ncbi:zinc finger protein GLIS1-like [Asbolus verrucosus]|uniref:Zinc finger protein GLIS1-like n=1 Tax=Asbolus verrucosus TaxID=1661398 RepID=A0A482VUA7_ASBVE|nr:zinc finger protein GLIS1-like [Asbolus verrucosus]
MTDLYNPTVYLSQAELMEKFNLAFYEGQNLTKTDVLSTFDESEIKDDYLIDYLISNNDSPSTDFDFNDFVRTFDENLCQSTDASTTISSENCSGNFSQFFVPPPLQSLDNLDLSDIDLCDALSNERRQHLSESESSNCDEEISSSSTLQCQWEHCYQIYDCQSSLVKHIEKCHVEVKRGDEFTCFWANCPRKVKPFNARYKLLIHMRVHSGEKPNKCPFEGCNKAFSRLENLKIHQRSHTGERPYLCQFPTCTKSFSNSSDRAKHQRTHFDTKPYACQVVGCTKKYTDPSSLRKHVKNHTNEEQMLIKKKNDDCFNSTYAKKFFDPNRQKAVKSEKSHFYASLEHNYSNHAVAGERKYDSTNIRQDLKNKISEKNKLRNRFL